MKEFKLGSNIALMRKKLGMTQGNVADYLGVSGAAVSKWEQGLSYPDLTLLPKLAGLFHTTIDQLLGYEPQLPANSILAAYHQFSKRLSEEPFERVEADVEQLLREYYSCFPLLTRMAQLYLNHYNFAQNQERVLHRIVQLCDRVMTFSNDQKLIQEVQIIYGSVLLLMNRPQELLEKVVSEVPIQFGVEKLIAEAYAMLGDVEKAKETLQITIFQHLIHMLSFQIEMLKYASAHQVLFDEMIYRLEKVIDLYRIEKINGVIKLIFFYEAALGYMRQQRPEHALRMLEGFYQTCKHLSFPMKICGDAYFDAIDHWIEENINAGPYAPRNEKVIKEDLINLLIKEPLLIPLHEHPQFKFMVNNLRSIFHLSQKGEEG